VKLAIRNAPKRIGLHSLQGFLAHGGRLERDQVQAFLDDLGERVMASAEARDK